MTVQAKCIQKIRDKNNNITGYVLQDCTGKQVTVSSKELKDAIVNKKIQIINLKLTVDNKLIGCLITFSTS